MDFFAIFSSCSDDVDASQNVQPAYDLPFFVIYHRYSFLLFLRSIRLIKIIVMVGCMDDLKEVSRLPNPVSSFIYHP